MDFESHLYIGNLNPKVTHGDIKQLLTQFGEVHGIFLKPGSTWALAKMLNQDDAWKAMKELHDKQFMGTILNVRKAEKGKARKPLPKSITPKQLKPNIKNEKSSNTPIEKSKGQPRVVYISQKHRRIE
jgi:RNA recognition motif-containing protein